MYDYEREKEIRLLAEQQVEEEKRQVIIEEEKTRLLRDHAPDYADYLPKGSSIFDFRVGSFIFQLKDSLF